MQEIVIENNHLIATICPSLGGRIVALYSKKNDCDILWPSQYDKNTAIGVDKPNVRGGSYPLAPYSNRIKNAQFIWDNETYYLPVSPIASPNAIHGTACYNEWAVILQSETSVTLQQKHSANTEWGFDFILEQNISINDNTLTNSMTITNTDKKHQPIALGYHPFFSAKKLKSIHIPAKNMWVLDNGIPVSPRDVSGYYNFNMPAPFTNEMDDLYQGVTEGCIVDYGTHMVSIQSNSENAILFSNDVDTFFCFEPVENINNAHNMQSNTNIQNLDTYELDHGLTALAPDDSHTFTMTISVSQIIKSGLNND